MKKVFLKVVFFDEWPLQFIRLYCAQKISVIMTAHYLHIVNYKCTMEQGNYSGKWLQKVPNVKM